MAHRWIVRSGAPWECYWTWSCDWDDGRFEIIPSDQIVGGQMIPIPAFQAKGVVHAVVMEGDDRVAQDDAGWLVVDCGGCLGSFLRSKDGRHSSPDCTRLRKRFIAAASSVWLKFHVGDRQTE